MKRIAWMFILLIALPLAGCSDDDPTEPAEERDPLSRIEQVGALPEGMAWAVGVEGSTGRLYTNVGGVWAPAASQGPLGKSVAPTGVVAVDLVELFLYRSGSSTVDHFADNTWTEEDLTETLTGGARLVRSGETLFLLETEGGRTLTRHESDWRILFGIDAPPALPRDAVVNGDGDLFVAYERTGEDTSAVLRSTGSTTYDNGFSGSLTALAAAGGDTVWAAGDRLIRYHGGDWTSVTAMPDTQQVVAIGLPGPGVLTLVCESGLIYRWNADTLTLLQEFALVEPLASVAYVRDDLIYGVVNQIEENTGHEVGILVRYDGTQWNTDFLAPPAVP